MSIFHIFLTYSWLIFNIFRLKSIDITKWINPLTNGEGRCKPLSPLFFLPFTQNYLEATHTWNFLTLQTFLLLYPISEQFEMSVQKQPMDKRNVNGNQIGLRKKSFKASIWNLKTAEKNINFTGKGTYLVHKDVIHPLMVFS